MKMQNKRSSMVDLLLFMIVAFVIILVSGMFAVFHYSAYGANISQMFAAFAFSVVVITGNQFFKSVGFGLGAHFMNNAIAFGLLKF